MLIRFPNNAHNKMYHRLPDAKIHRNEGSKMGFKLIVKLMMNCVVLIPLLYWLTDASLLQICTSSVVLALIAFFIGDQWILRKSNNFGAVLADIGLTGLYFWAVAEMYDWTLSFTELFIVVAVLAFVEAMYHRLLEKWDKHSNAFSYEPKK
jgi:hypothetical protein